MSLMPLTARALVLVALAALLSCARAPAPETIVLRGEALGAFYAVTVAAPPEGVDKAVLREVVEETLDRINRLMSTYREDSELSRFNRYADAAPFPLSPETYAVFEMAQRIAAESDGAFDVTIGPLVNAWGFGPDAFDAPPDDETVQALLERVGYRKLRLHEDGSISKRRPEIYCDLSGIAKGYAVDAVAEALETRGVTRYLVEVGGEIRVLGRNPSGEPWAIGIEAPLPDRRELHTVVRMTRGALATSGDYRNLYEVEGRLVSHTIDPETGQPIQHGLASASVVHESCAMADGYATALMALGPERAHAFAVEHDLAALLIVRDDAQDDFEAIATPAFQTLLSEHERSSK